MLISTYFDSFAIKICQFWSVLVSFGQFWSVLVSLFQKFRFPVEAAFDSL